ncbi:hypothetical protein F2Q69_00045082 [Brassica cretica]|uniref:Uncharacterized protein n=1 Tax=Brassica cretica TaxID=69181 RepID=A0A8S9NH08_BRACR|nr:hypothetical protein F2Q69_00045082 [Brassica cretica]
MAVSDYLWLRMMVVTSLTTSWRVVAPATSSDGDGGKEGGDGGKEGENGGVGKEVEMGLQHDVVQSSLHPGVQIWILSYFIFCSFKETKDIKVTTQHH